ncbi:MAG: class GN sortase [Aestuariivirgaceae bacterium]
MTAGALPRRAAMAASCLVIAAGLALAGQGMWIKAKAAVAQVLLERAFSQAVRTGGLVKAWRWADTRPVARISSERLSESAIVLAGGSGEAMAFGPGHLAGTPPPGAPGTAVIAAHRDTHFNFLKHLKAGDTLSITRDDGLRFSFQVTDTKIVRWDRPNIDVNASGRNLVLATCWPFDAKTRGPLRYVVHAQLAE